MSVSARRPLRRKTCAVCNQENVAHLRGGKPTWAHNRGKRHVDALRNAPRTIPDRKERP